jgi:hypothetical protein
MNQELKTMKTTMKTMILGFLVLTLALGFTSCGDKEDDPTPSNPNELSLNNFIGTWLSDDVVLYNGTTLNNPCDDNWTVSNFRKIKLEIASGVQASNIYSNKGISYPECNQFNILPTFSGLTTTFDKTVNLLKINSYHFEVSNVTSTSFKGKLIFSGGNISTPLNATYTFIKQP